VSVTIKRKSKVIISTILPGTCVLCKGSISHHNNCLCNLCIANLPWLLNKCHRCSIPSAPDKLCPDCQKIPVLFHRCISAIEHKIGSVDKLIMNIKKKPFALKLKNFRDFYRTPLNRPIKIPTYQALLFLYLYIGEN
jgi:hypothetical protein